MGGKISFFALGLQNTEFVRLEKITREVTGSYHGISEGNASTVRDKNDPSISKLISCSPLSLAEITN